MWVTTVRGQHEGHGGPFLFPADLSLQEPYKLQTFLHRKVIRHWKGLHREAVESLSLKCSRNDRMWHLVPQSG